MRVFVTGASGFIGTHLIKELTSAGHTVLGLARSDEAAAQISKNGGEVLRGSLEDLASLKSGAQACDGVINLAFNHDFTKFAANSEVERNAIRALGEALVGTKKPLVITAGVGKVKDETEDPPSASDIYPRSPEEALAEVTKAGVIGRVVRLPQVHNRSKQGLITMFIAIAKDKGEFAYIGEGKNRFAAVHVLDAARLYRLVLEYSGKQTKFHAIAEEGVPIKDMAETLGKRLNLPVVSKTPEQAPAYFGTMAMFAGWDLAATSEITQKELNWHPKGADIITDLQHLGEEEPVLAAKN